jgi:putative membrane protein
MADHQATLEKLRTLKGADFDREFVRAMVKDHQMVIERVTHARSRINDPELTGLVDKLLPTLKQHLSMAQKLQGSLSKS